MLYTWCGKGFEGEKRRNVLSQHALILLFPCAQGCPVTGESLKYVAVKWIRDVPQWDRFTSWPFS